MLKALKTRRARRLAAFNHDRLRTNTTTIADLANQILNLPDYAPITPLAEHLQMLAAEVVFQADIVDTHTANTTA